MGLVLLVAVAVAVCFACVESRVLVVLGCSMSLLEGRVASAASVASPDDVVVFSGGFGEAELADWLFEHRYGGNPRTTRLLERNSRTTKENAELARQLLAGRGRGEENMDIVVVTDWFHRPRAMALFQTYFRSASSLRFLGTSSWQQLPLTHVLWCCREVGAMAKAIAAGHVDPFALFYEIVKAAKWLLHRLRLRVSQLM